MDQVGSLVMSPVKNREASQSDVTSVYVPTTNFWFTCDLEPPTFSLQILGIQILDKNFISDFFTGAKINR